MSEHDRICNELHEFMKRIRDLPHGKDVDHYYQHAAGYIARALDFLDEAKGAKPKRNPFA